MTSKDLSMCRDRQPPSGSLPFVVGSILILFSIFLSVGVDARSRRSLSYQFPMDQLEAFSFDVTSRIQTQFEKKPADASRFDLMPVEERLAEVRTRVRGHMERSLARVFRDNSLGIISRVTGLEGSVERGSEDGNVPLDLSLLEGKSVALRIHASGELLDSHGWSHLLGAQRPGSVLGDLFLHSTLRLPPHLPKPDQPASVAFRTRIPVDSSLQRDWSWTLTFSRSEATGDCGKGCVALSYSGEVFERSIDSHPARPMQLSGKATVRGEVVLRGKRGRLWSHTWVSQWTNTLTSQSGAGRIRGVVTQTLHQEGSIRSESEARTGLRGASEQP